MKKVVIASNNPGKLREFAALLAPFDFEAVPQGEFGVPEANEPHFTFIENALAKARHASVATGLPALADDSGICAVALGDAPGVHSARYAGLPVSDERNCAKLLAELKPHADRRAYYYCALVMVMDANDPQPLIAGSEWYGEIIDTPRGSNGFGYDPLFLIPDLGLTAAELSTEAKNQISHRGKAMRHLAERLRGRR